MKHRIRFIRSMSLLLALVLLFTMSPLSAYAVSGADAEETTAERGAPEMSSSTTTPTEGTPAEVTVTNASARSASEYYDSLAEAAAVNNAASIRYSNVKANTDLEYVLKGELI